MLSDSAADLGTALRRRLGPAWEFAEDDGYLEIRHRNAGGPYRPPRRELSWSELLRRLEDALREQGQPRGRLLPLAWHRETDFTISAVQALDPYLKDRRPYVYSEGYLPQPVVRFTGQRTEAGQLQDGFLTGFVNTSLVRRIDNVDMHAELIDCWLGALSRLGLHARHIRIQGRLDTWQRVAVRGVTLRLEHAGLLIGDAVLLWNGVEPGFMAADIGSGLERLRWGITRTDWKRMVFGEVASLPEVNLLDAIRTATLIVGNSMEPSSRGTGGALRRVLSAVPPQTAALGLSRVVQQAHIFWSLVSPLRVPWPEVCRAIEHEVLGDVTDRG